MTRTLSGSSRTRSSIGASTDRVDNGFFKTIDADSMRVGEVVGDFVGEQAAPFQTGYFGTVYSDEVLCGGLNVALINNLRPVGGKYSKYGETQTMTGNNGPLELLVGPALGSQNFVLQTGDQYRLFMFGSILTGANKNVLLFSFKFGETEFFNTGPLSLSRTGVGGAETWSYELTFGMGTRPGTLSRVIENDLRCHGVFSYLTTQESIASMNDVDNIPLGQNLALSVNVEWIGDVPKNVLRVYSVYVVKAF
jgi:hypothetical protein